MSDSKMGKLLPNLTVTVGKNKSDLDESLEDGEISDAESFREYSDMSNKEVVRNWMNTLDAPKFYMNKMGGFETGIDLSSPSLMKKLEERAERFGLNKRERSQITQLEIDALYKSLGLDPKDLKSSCKNIRLKVIHIRGVSEMNTKEVLDYFIDYGPSTLEWINDISCNVCFVDELSAARSLIGLSKPFVVKKKNRNQGNLEEIPGEPAIIEMSDSDEEVKESDRDEVNIKDRKKCVEFDLVEEEKPSENDDTGMEIDDHQHNSNSGNDTKTAAINVPIPPGYWRLGVPHKKAKAILLRFATNDDKKVPGAEKRSQYYQKYGNPNYGGLKGLISTSRKRRFQSNRNKVLISEMSASNSDPLPTPEYEKRTKAPRMRMYADEEEEKRKKVGKDFGRITNIKDRLGKKYTSDDFHYMSRDFSDEYESSEQEELSVSCKIPSKYKIWNEEAKLMAKTEKRETRESSFRLGRFRPYKHDDLRTALKSAVHATDGSKNDLRSKIKTLKEDRPNKHRSPLCVDSD